MVERALSALVGVVVKVERVGHPLCRAWVVGVALGFDSGDLGQRGERVALVLSLRDSSCAPCLTSDEGVSSGCSPGRQ